jgi:hypothetical protein
MAARRITVKQFQKITYVILDEMKVAEAGGAVGADGSVSWNLILKH